MKFFGVYHIRHSPFTIHHGQLEKTISAGVEQTWEYMDQCGAVEGHLVIFERAANKPWQEKIFARAKQYAGQRITVWGM